MIMVMVFALTLLQCMVTLALLLFRAPALQSWQAALALQDRAPRNSKRNANHLCKCARVDKYVPSLGYYEWIRARPGCLVNQYDLCMLEKVSHRHLVIAQGRSLHSIQDATGTCAALEAISGIEELEGKSLKQ